MGLTGRADTMANYAILFRDHIARSIVRCSARMELSGQMPAAGDREQALHTLSYALNVEDIWPETRALLLALAPKMEQAGHRDDWLPYLDSGIEQCQRLGDVPAEAALHWHKGVVLELRCLYDDAREELSFSVAQFAAVGDSRNQARALNKLANVARLQRQVHEAERLVETAMVLLEPDDTERAYGLIVMGAMALDACQWPAAADYFSQAIDVYRASGDQRMLAWSLTNLGVAQRKLKDYQRAIACYHEAIAVFEKVHDPVHRAAVHINLGNVFLKVGNVDEALASYRQAEPVFYQVRDNLHLAFAYVNIGMACRLLGRWREAERALSTSIDLLGGLNRPKKIANCREELGLTYQAQGRTAEAITQYEQALDALNDRGADQELRNSILANLHVARQISSTPAPAST